MRQSGLELALEWVWRRFTRLIRTLILTRMRILMHTPTPMDIPTIIPDTLIRMDIGAAITGAAGVVATAAITEAATAAVVVSVAVVASEVEAAVRAAVVFAAAGAGNDAAD